MVGVWNYYAHRHVMHNKVPLRMRPTRTLPDGKPDVPLKEFSTFSTIARKLASIEVDLSFHFGLIF